MNLIVWWCNQGNEKIRHGSKDKKTLLKVVQGYFLSLTSIVRCIATREKEL